MKADTCFSLDRSTMLWLSAATIVSLLPLLAELVFWLPLLHLGIAFWCVLFSSRQLPSARIKVAITLGSSVALYLSFPSFFNLPALLSLLVLAYSLKLLEIAKRRDFVLLIFLGCFISACQLLLSSSIGAFVYALFSCCILHYVLIVHLLKSKNYQNSIKMRVHRPALYQMAIMTAQALPIAVVLFLIMPRLGSFWQMPLNTQQAKSGMSDSLSAGDFSGLSQDASVAMRVTFTSRKILESSQLYWRGVVLSEFDGRTWRRPKNEPEKVKALKRVQGESSGVSIDYQVMLEATRRTWLYSLGMPINQQRGIQRQSDFTLARDQVSNQRFSYTVQSLALSAAAKTLSTQEQLRYTQLPARGNGRSRALAKSLLEQYQQPTLIVAALMEYFNQEFSYTLQPGKLSREDGLDDFLFDLQRGYCEYFASSAAFVLRAAGIPTRIVTGYQGGEWSTDESYLLVRQSDAHAWLEVWYAGTGWQRIDPTAAVAPARIELGQSEFTRSSGLQVGVFNSSLVRQWGLQWDSVNYQWHRFVLGYDSQLQLAFIFSLFGEESRWKIVLVFAVTIFIVLVPWWLRGRFKQRKHYTPLEKLLKKTESVLGDSRRHGEPVGRWLYRLRESEHKDVKEMEVLANLFNKLMYAPQSAISRRLIVAEIKTALKNI